MATSEQTTARHFSVSGEAITKIARDMLLSEMPAKAWRLLAQNLIGGRPGQAEAIATAVLDGKKKLVGDSSIGIGVVKERGAKSYLKDLHYIYAGRIKIDGRWHRPQARVASVNERDAHYATKKLGFCPSKLSHDFEKWCLYRVEFYGHGRGRAIDITKYTPKAKARSRSKMRRADAEIDVVLFEECSEPPHWWPEPSSPREAYDQFVAAGRRLDVIDVDQGVPLGETEDFDEEPNVRSEDDSVRVKPYVDHRGARERKEEIEAEIALEEEAEAKRLADQITAYRAYGEKIRKQANDDFIEIKLPDGYVPTMSSGPRSYMLGDDDPEPVENVTPSSMFSNGVLRVPRLPFECWCLWRTHVAHLMPKWECISPSGLKMAMDDPYHTDWMLGADVHLRHSYDASLKSVSLDMMRDVQRKYGKFEHAVIVGGPDVEGIVGKAETPGAIMVLHDLRNTPENNLAVGNASAIITENGGELAHVATVARENKIPVFRVPNAVKLFRVGTRLRLYPSQGKIHSNGTQWFAEDE